METETEFKTKHKPVKHQSLPVKGYQPQDNSRIAMVNSAKVLEERVLRFLDMLRNEGSEVDQHWLAIGRTHIEQGFMAANRSVFKPERVRLPEDQGDY